MAIDQELAKRARVIIADDNKAMRDIVIGLLANNFEIVGAVGEGCALVDKALELRPELGIIDISMPTMNGIDAAIEIKRRGSPMKIIILTVNEDCDFVRAAFEAGASAYVIKRKMATDLPLALDEVLAGRTFVSTGCHIHQDS